MRWLAVHLPDFALQAHARDPAATTPLAIVDGAAGRQQVVACNAPAGAAGVLPGMGLAAAWALLPALRILHRDAAAERQALDNLAAWAGQFSAAVSLQDGTGLLLEIGASLRLFGGLDGLLETLRRGLVQLGYRARLASAPTASGAWWLVRGLGEVHVADQRGLRARLAGLSVAYAGLDGRAREALRGIGVASLGELLALPRDGLARRLGPGLLERLDQALGRLPEARLLVVPQPDFSASLGLPDGAGSHESLLFPVRRLLGELRGYLAGNGRAVRRLVFELQHSGLPPSTLEVGLLAAGQDTQRMLMLFRAQLERLRLPGPVEAVRLTAREFEVQRAVNRDLFLDEAPDRDWRRLAEILAARLGADAVRGLAAIADHRPERAWRVRAPGSPAAPTGVAGRPVWLLERPEPLRADQGFPCRRGRRLIIRSGAERIEGGWWDGHDIRRDYYRAEDCDGAQLWIYRERQAPRAWYLHGLFG